LEARGFREALPRFDEKGAMVVGISSDRPRAQKRFVERDGLSYPMLCDPDRTAIRAYGVRSFLGLARRVSFLIDPSGIVRRVYTKVSPRSHAVEILRDLETLTAGGTPG
jgi:peroxiredoxin Q/BCP